MAQTRRISSYNAITILLIVVVVLLFVVGILNTTILKELREQGRLRAIDLFDVWAIGDSYKIYRDGTLALPTQPPAYKTSNAVWSSSTSTISLNALKQETVAFQLAIKANANLTNVDVTVSDLTSPSGTIPATALTRFFEHYIYAPYNDPSLRPGALRRDWYPDALIPFFDPYNASSRIVSPFSVTNATTQPIWFDVRVPRDVAAGEYSGTITVSADGQSPILLTILVNVLNAELPAERPLAVDIGVNKAKFMGGIEVAGSFSLESANWPTLIWPQYVKLMQLGREHGFDTSPLLNPVEPVITTDANDVVTNIDWTRYDQYFGQILNGSIFEDGQPPQSWRLPNRSLGTWQTAPPTLPANEDRYIRSLAPLMENHFSTVLHWDLSKSYVLGIDEPIPSQYGTQASYYSALKAVSDLNLFLPFRPQMDHDTGIGINDLLNSTDIWVPHGPDYFPTFMNQRRTAGQQTWFYQGEEPGLGMYTINADALGYRVWPWSAWKYGAQGFLNWSGTYWDENQPFVLADANALQDDWGIGEGTLFYPGKKLSTIGYPDIDGPLSSVRMKALRRGILDTQLFNALKGLQDEQFVNARIDTLLQSSLCETYDENAGYGTPPRFYCPPYWADPRFTDGLPEWEKDPELWETAINDMRLRLVELLTPEPPCIESWVCDETWGECIDGAQTRACWDENECGTEVDKPATSQECEMPCIENWDCDTEWSACVDGTQARTCTDLNACGTFEFRPDLAQSCTLPCVEAWECTGWGSCVDGTQTQSCFDRNDCGTTIDRPPLSQSCTACQEHWVCDDAWGECNDGAQSRSCTDANGCGTTYERPPLSQSCGSGGPIDTITPDTIFTTQPQPVIKITSASFSWSGSDDSSETRNLRYSWRTDGGTWSPYGTETATTISALSVGSHTFEVRALDEAGNEDPSPVTASFAVRHSPIIVVGPRTGQEPRIRVYRTDGKLIRSFLAFKKSYRGGVNVAVGDLGTDGVPEIIVGAGPNHTPDIKVFTMRGEFITQFAAYAPTFRGGVNVAVGDLNDGTAEIIVAPAAAGGPSVRVFHWNAGRYQDLTPAFRAYKKTFRGGIALAVTDLDGNGTGEIVTVPTSGSKTELRVFEIRGKTFRQTYTPILVFESAFRGGVSLAASDINGNGRNEIVVGAAAKRNSTIRLLERDRNGRLVFRPERVVAFHPNYEGGVSLAALDTDADGKTEIVASVRNDEKPYVRLFTASLDRLQKEFYGASRKFLGGLSLGAGN